MNMIRILPVFSILYVLSLYPHYSQCIHWRLKRMVSILLFSIPYALSVQDVYQAVCLPLLCVIAVTDLKYGEIPDTAVMMIALAGFLKMDTRGLIPAAVMFVSLLPFALKEKIGFGDVKLICAWALLKGQDVFAGCAAASIACLLFMYMKKGSSMRIIPFGPFLSFGFLLTLF